MSAIRNSGVSVFQGVVKCAIKGMYCSDYVLCPHYSVSPHFRGVRREEFHCIIIQETALKTFPGHRHIYAPFDAIVVCGTFCTMLVLNVVWSLIQGLQICKRRSYRLCI